MTWPRAILFDVDGTLAETEEWHRAAFNEAFAAHGLDWHWDRNLYRELLKIAGGKERMRYFAGPAVDDSRLSALHAFKNERYRRFVASGAVEFRPGIAALIDHARAHGIRLGIATTTSRSNVEALLAGVSGPAAPAWFEVLACAEDAAAKKPDPAVYRFALNALGLSPDEVLAVEDSANGVYAAIGAGLACLLTPSFYCRCENVPDGVLVVDDLARLSPGHLLDRLWSHRS